MASLPHPVSHRSHSGSRALTPALARTAAYWLAAGAVYVVFGFLWYDAAKEKLIDDSGTMPAGLAKSFHGSFVASVPGLNAAWTILGIAEAVACLLFAVSLVLGEFLPGRAKPVLLTAVAFSALTFAVMAFANDMTGDFDGSAQLYQYLIGAVIVGVGVLACTPARVGRWLSGDSEAA